MTWCKAVGAILVQQRDRVAFQHRDLHIKHLPGWYGEWGGGVEEGETPEQAIRRELAEELSNWDGSPFRPGTIIPLMSIQLRYPPKLPTGFEGTNCDMYLVPILCQATDLIVREGRGMGVFTFDEALRRTDICPTGQMSIQYINRFGPFA